ncbi:PH domain-containing protein [Salinicoccus cyprini]|uniref:PH domain-containing protein n=1 Tax=Salinicoccus cyprini TaxID=2493691 RepID=A0A558ASH7_9STAP|nr:PH domain-containing protein [Salinicoccus cyprini]TVT27221.1 PH domain-containing protein [Salinicoccus cyprini]
MYSPQKLHPIAYLGSVVNGIKNLWIPLLIILFQSRESIFSGNVSMKYILIGGGILVLAIILFGGMDFLNKYRTRFWIEDGKFIYKDGVITNREKELDIRRIQSIDFSEPIFHRLFGAVKLDIITPGDGIKIDTMKKSQAISLQDILYDEKSYIRDEVAVGDSSDWPRKTGEKDQATEAPSEVLYHMNGRSLLLMSMTSGALGAFLALVFGFLNLIGADFLIERYFDYFEGVIRNIVLAIGLAVGLFIVVGYAIGILIMSMKYYKYTLRMKHDDLIVEYGLLEKKHQSVNINRVQNIIIKDSILRRMIGYYSLSVTITSDSLDSEDIDGTVDLLPFIKRDRLYEIVGQIFPNYHLEAPPGTVPGRGYRRYFQIMTVILLMVTAAVQYFWFDYAWIIGLVLILAFVVSGVYSARNSGYAIHGDEINLMTVGFFKRSHYVIKQEKLIEAEWVYNPFLRRDDLGIITLVTAAGMLGSRATLKFIDQKDIDKIWNWAERSTSHAEDFSKGD